MTRIDEPLPPSLSRILLFLNAVVGVLSVSQLAEGNPTVSAWLAISAGVLNQAIQIFVGVPNKTSPYEKVTDSTLSDRRELRKRQNALSGGKDAKGGPK